LISSGLVFLSTNWSLSFWVINFLSLVIVLNHEGKENEPRNANDHKWNCIHSCHARFTRMALEGTKRATSCQDVQCAVSTTYCLVDEFELSQRIWKLRPVNEKAQDKGKKLSREQERKDIC
jgi:hypothetical protein